MIWILLAFIPIIIISISSIFSLGNKKEIKNNRKILFTGLIIAWIVNGIYIYSISFFRVEFSPLYLDISLVSNAYNFWWIEIFLSMLIIIALPINAILKNSHTKGMISTIYLLFSSSIIGIFLTDNLLVISIFYSFGIFYLYFFFSFGKYKKKQETMSRFKNVAILSFISLLIANIVTIISCKSLELSKIVEVIAQRSLFTQIIIFFGYLVGFGIVCGLFPLLNFHLKSFYKISNPIAIRLLNNIFFPVSMLLLCRNYLFISSTNPIFSNITFLFGFIGFIFSVIFTFSNKAFLRVGNVSILEFNLFLLILSLKDLSFINFSLNSSNYFNLIQNFLILSIFAKSLLSEGIIVEKSKKSVENLLEMKNRNIFEKIILIVFPLIYLFPGFIGYSFLELSLGFSYNNFDISSIRSVQLLSILISTIVFLVVLLFILIRIKNIQFYGSNISSFLLILLSLVILFILGPKFIEMQKFFNFN